MRTVVPIWMLCLGVLRLAGTSGEEVCSDTLPPVLVDPVQHKCNDDYECVGNVFGCLCPSPQSSNTIYPDCDVWPSYPRRGRCMCKLQPTPAAADRAVLVLPVYQEVPAVQEFVTHTGESHWVVECPVCNTNYQGQLSPNDPQGCRMRPDGVKAQNTAMEKQALDQLYHNTLGVLWLRNWDTSIVPCERYGVRCRGTTVVALELSDNNLQGMIPPSIATNLPDLEVLDLSHNLLSGTIPSELGGFVLLTHLLLGHNRLNGDIPSLSSCSFLATLDLSHNRLTGPINLHTLLPVRSSPPFPPPKPRAAGSSSSATAAAAAATQQQVSSLVHLHLQYNGLSKILAPAAEDASTRKWNLKLLDFSHNVITGALPPFFLYLPSLTALDLSHNLLSGMLPPFPLVSDLRRVSLRGNAISGNFPSSWERLWDVTRLSELEEQSGTDDGGLLLDVAHTCLQGNVSKVLARQGNATRVTYDTSSAYNNALNA